MDPPRAISEDKVFLAEVLLAPLPHAIPQTFDKVERVAIALRDEALASVHVHGVHGRQRQVVLERCFRTSFLIVHCFWEEHPRCCSLQSVVELLHLVKHRIE